MFNLETYMYTLADSNDFILFEFPFNSSFVEFLLNDLWLKIERILLPKIVSRSKENIDTDHKLYCSCKRPAFGQMIACDAKNCTIEGYHYSCVNITRAPKRSWFCNTRRVEKNEQLKTQCIKFLITISLVIMN